jgi:tetratricopeptide (TPR) repeat protein
VSLFPDLDDTFQHALTHEVAYGGLLLERRRALHARIVDVIEALYGDRLAEHVERLAHHALRGEAWENAVRYASEAGRKAAARRAHREAVTWFEHALAALARLPDTIDRQTQAIDLRLDIRSSLVSLEDFASVPYHLRQAEPLANALGDRDRQSAIASALAHCLRATGQLQEGLEAGQHALELATRAGNPALQRSAGLVLGQIRHALGDYEQAIAHFADNIEAESLDEALRWRHVGPAIASVVNRRWLAMSLAEVGRFTDAIAFGTEAVEIAETADHPYSLLNALVGLGFALVRKGDVDRAIPLLERACEVSASLSNPIRSVCATSLATAYGLAGRSPDAAAVLANPLVTLLSPSGSLAESYLHGGRVDEASRLAVQELDLARAQRSQAGEAWALHVLGEIAAGREPLDAEAAQTYLRQALVLAIRLGMRPLVAHCHLGLGKLSLRTGKQQEAHEHLTTATTMYREMDMRFWLEQAEAELRRL